MKYLFFGIFLCTTGISTCMEETEPLAVTKLPKTVQHLIADYLTDKWDYKAKTVGHNKAAIHTISFSENGSYIATGSWDGIARLWNPPPYSSDTILAPNDIWHWTNHAAEKTATNNPRIAAISAHGHYLATTVNSDRAVRVWRRFSLEKLFDFECDGIVTALAFSPDEERLAITLFSDTNSTALCILVMLELKKQIPLYRITQPIAPRKQEYVYVTFSADGKLLAVTPNSMATFKTIEIIDLATKKIVQEIHIRGLITALAFSADNKYLAIGSKPEALADHLYTSINGQLCGQSEMKSQKIRNYRTLKIWNLIYKTYAHTHKLPYEVTALSFSKDSLAVGFRNGTIAHYQKRAGFDPSMR